MDSKSSFLARLPAIMRETSRMNVIICLVALAIVLNAIFNHLVSRNGLQELIEPGNGLPAFTMKLIGGREIANRDFRGKPAIFFLFANWCPCAHLSVKFVKRAFEENRGIAVYGVGIQDSRARYADFAKKHGITFPVADRGGDDFADSIGIRTTPSLVFVDENGIIRSYFMGKVERYEQVEKGLQAIITPTPPAAPRAADPATGHG